MSKPTLAQLLAESARNAELDNHEKKWADLQKQANAPHRRPRAEEQGVCPACGYASSLDDFDAGDDSQGDDYKPDDVSSATDNQDDVNSRDTDGKVRENNNRAIDRLNNLTRLIREANKIS